MKLAAFVLILTMPLMAQQHQIDLTKQQTEYQNIFHFAEPAEGGRRWLIRATFTGVCGLVKRKDGFAHSNIAGVEYVQTCHNGKLGILHPYHPRKP